MPTVVDAPSLTALLFIAVKSTFSPVKFIEPGTPEPCTAASQDDWPATLMPVFVPLKLTAVSQLSPGSHCTLTPANWLCLPLSFKSPFRSIVTLPLKSIVLMLARTPSLYTVEPSCTPVSNVSALLIVILPPSLAEPSIPIILSSTVPLVTLEFKSRTNFSPFTVTSEPPVAFIPITFPPVLPAVSVTVLPALPTMIWPLSLADKAVAAVLPTAVIVVSPRNSATVPVLSALTPIAALYPSDTPILVLVSVLEVKLPLIIRTP